LGGRLAVCNYLEIEGTSTSLLASRPILSLQASALLTAEPTHKRTIANYINHVENCITAGQPRCRTQLLGCIDIGTPSILLPDTLDTNSSITTSFAHSSGYRDFDTLSDPLIAFPDLETEFSQPDLDFWNLEFPFNNTIGAEVELSDSLALFPQGLAIRPAVEELLEIASEAASQRDGASPISTISSFTPSPLPTSSPSPSIRCSWPTCEKVFKNRSDYKYVFPPETVRSDLIYSCFTAITADTTTYRSSVCPVLFVKPQRESLIGTSIQFTSSLRSTFARFLHAADP